MYVKGMIMEDSQDRPDLIKFCFHSLSLVFGSL